MLDDRLPTSPPSRYDDEGCAVLRETEAAIVLLIVVDGEKGSGFTVAADAARVRMSPQETQKFVSDLLIATAHGVLTSSPINPHIRREGIQRKGE